MADEFTKVALYWIKTFNKKVKEKIWMQKLINLLNEYEWFKENEFESWRINEYGHLTEWGDYMRIWTNAKIISKQFWFIKWLVENDKIDLVKFSDKLSSSSWTMEDRYKYLNSDFWLYNSILMLLSISDTPIEDLLLYLK